MPIMKARDEALISIAEVELPMSKRWLEWMEANSEQNSGKKSFQVVVGSE